MYLSDKRERLIRNSRAIQELSREVEFRSQRGENVAPLRRRIDALAGEQESLSDQLFGIGTLRYGEVHRTVFHISR